MIQVGDLVRSLINGKVGIVTALVPDYVNYCYVLMHDNTYTIHTTRLELLEKK